MRSYIVIHYALATCMPQMRTRREFLKSAAVTGIVGLTAGPAQTLAQTAAAPAPGDDRGYWLSVLDKLATPVLGHLSRRDLRKSMPVETTGNATDRARYTHLEAFGRLLCGLAPWFEAGGLSDDESRRQRSTIELARTALDAATDPQSPDFMNFDNGGQPLVDAAFLAQAILRAPRVLWKEVDPRIQRQTIAALKSSRRIATPDRDNWVMFAATIEAALLEMGEPTLEERLENCVRRMVGWYKGDGAYGDGEFFHFDYYNSFVIHPMLVDVLMALVRHDSRFASARTTIVKRAQRYAEVQERLIAPDGTFPSLGRSITYRFGAFQDLAQMALLHELPERVKPGQVRTALTAVMRRMMEASGTFDDNGWLRIGFCGHQPSLGEGYISTGSLYLCAMALLPLGLPPADPFWSDPPGRWTSQRLWAGENLPADHALADTGTVDIPTLERPQKQRGVS